MCCSEEECRQCEQKGMKVDPQECSPEKIKECHGDVDQHPCEKEE